MTGREIWRGSTDGRTGGNPISYQTRSGRQFVVISTSGGQDSGAGLVAFALKRGGTAPTAAAATPAARPAAPAASAASAMTGQQAFTNVCSGCHGRTAGGGMGPGLAGMTKGNEEFLAIVREGRGQMPATGPRDLTDDQILLIAEYVRSLGGDGLLEVSEPTNGHLDHSARPCSSSACRWISDRRIGSLPDDSGPNR
jgi:mono/diheme cytochrome c family protein